ncbi:MAG: carboxypeptidase-like regulatory domain-containing protein, partial [Candidatus Nezhaarchaeota archaeon]|nr:carboxypeptidase-like regulatory domain-containing protein [Candidatus Nezhaarchaeota archaeon]
FRLIDGKSLPHAFKNLTIVFTCNSSTRIVDFLNSTVLRDSIKYESNQTKGVVFVGGYKYPLVVYSTWVIADGKTRAAVLVFNGTVELPKPEVSLEKEVSTYIIPVTVTAYDYAGVVKIPGLTIEHQWAARNITKKTADELRDVTRMYGWACDNLAHLKNVKAHKPGEVVLANMTGKLAAVTDADGKAIIYVPRWSFPRVVNFTTVRYDVETKPGVTPGVPSGLEAAPVVYQNETIGVGGGRFNVTAVASMDVKTYATTLTVSLIDYLGRPLVGYVVNLTIKEYPYKLNVSEKARIVGTVLTGAGGRAVFSSSPAVCYWTNYSYVVWAYPRVVGSAPAVKAYNLSKNWSPGYTVTAKFEGVIKAALVDALNIPLEGQLVVGRAAMGLGVGKAVVSSLSGRDGVAELILPEAGSFYYYAVYDPVKREYILDKTDGVHIYAYWTRGGTPFLEVMIGVKDGVVPGAYVLVPCKVFYAKFLLVSDTGRALEKVALKPAEPVPIKVTYYLAGKARPEVFSLEGYAFDNATFKLDRCPIGDYLIEAWWPGKKIKIYEALTPIEDNIPAPGVPEVARKLKCLVYDITLNFKTPKGTVCANATATITWPQGVKTTEVTDSLGNVLLINVPVGRLSIDKLVWRGFDSIVKPIPKDITSTTTYYVIADNIVALNVRVIGARGQGLPYASVTVEKAPLSLTTTTDEGGFVPVELPRAVYTVSALYKGKSGSVTADLTKPGVEFSATVTLDVWLELFGYAMSAGEFALSIVLLIIVAFIIAFIVHEYVVWRRKRIAVAVVKT